ncbi:formin-like protein 12 isoform X1 [Argonauta hians]
MATNKRRLFLLFIISTILLQFVVEYCEARRSTGSRSSSSRSSRIYRSSRTSRTSRTSRSSSTSSRYYPTRTTYTRSRLQVTYGTSITRARSSISRIGWKSALLAGGMLYIGSQAYMTRRLYHMHPTRRPAICSNFVDADENGTVYKMFICPRPYESDNMIRCCGYEGQQTCCAVVRSSGSVVGIIIGSILTVIIIALIIYCVCRSKKKQSGEVLSKDGEGSGIGMTPPSGDMSPSTPHGPPPMGYGPGMMPPPPGMDPNQGYPYPAPAPGDPMVPPPYAQPYPGGPGMPPPGMAPGMPPPGMAPGMPPPGMAPGMPPPGMAPGMPPPGMAPGMPPPGMAPGMPPPGVAPGMPPPKEGEPQQPPPPPGFYGAGAQPPPPPYAMP